MIIYVKNMVCNRCISAVKQEFEKVGLNPVSVKLGEVEINKEPREKQLRELTAALSGLGFEILDNQKQKAIATIKNLIISKVQSGNIEEHFILSEFLSRKLNKEYSQISRLFSEVEGVTIEQFFILQKIEKVKEWITYDELNLNEISWNLGYSSLAHLSSQFKKVTGISPSQFKKMGINHRKSLDHI